MPNKKQKIFFIFSSLVLLLFFAPSLFAQNQISVSVLNNGGEKQSSTNYVLVGTVGQPGSHLITSSGYQVLPGFWNTYYQDVVVSVENEEAVPSVFKLEQNYPNPFNPSTIIKFAVPQRSNVLIKIYDIIGSELLTLVNEELESGWYEKVFNASGYASGIYICRMQAGDFTKVIKMLLIK